MLVLLDNARNAEQVRPLLPGTAGCLAVVTSRDQLSSLAVREGAQVLALDVLSDYEARQLLERRLGRDRVAAEPEAVEEIISLCARLPLALAVVAARAAAQADFPLHVLMDRLREADRTFDILADSDAASDVRTVFSWSYRALDADAARLFRLLGLHPGPDIAAPAAASLAAIPVTRARQLLTELVQDSLLTEHVPGRYTFHDLLRAYAGELARRGDPAEDFNEAGNRLLDHYLATAHAANLVVYPEPKRGMCSATPTTTSGTTTMLLPVTSARSLGSANAPTATTERKPSITLGMPMTRPETWPPRGPRGQRRSASSTSSAILALTRSVTGLTGYRSTTRRARPSCGGLEMYAVQTSNAR
jgi:hypothetical protein